MFLTPNLSSSVRALWIVGGLICLALPAGAQNVRVPDAERLEPIVVTAKKHANPVPDEKLTEQVGVALHSDPTFYDEHVTVTVKNGVVLLEGIVFDASDVAYAIRKARRIAGVKRVVTDLYVPDGQ